MDDIEIVISDRKPGDSGGRSGKGRTAIVVRRAGRQIGKAWLPSGYDSGDYLKVLSKLMLKIDGQERLKP